MEENNSYTFFLPRLRLDLTHKYDVQENISRKEEVEEQKWEKIKVVENRSWKKSRGHLKLFPPVSRNFL